MSPTMDPNLQGGTRANLAAGVNFVVPDRFGGILEGQRLAVEFQMPVYQNLDGPQMALDWTIVAGWQYAFKLILAYGKPFEKNETQLKGVIYLC